MLYVSINRRLRRCYRQSAPHAQDVMRCRPFGTTGTASGAYLGARARSRLQKARSVDVRRRTRNLAARSSVLEGRPRAPVLRAPLLSQRTSTHDAPHHELSVKRTCARVAASFLGCGVRTAGPTLVSLRCQQPHHSRLVTKTARSVLLRETRAKRSANETSGNTSKSRLLSRNESLLFHRRRTLALMAG
jgi:hypothetical protein